MQADPTPEALKPLCWLMGKWKSISAKGYFPTIQPFEYSEEMEFTCVGQPILNYSSVTWHPIKKNPMHLENGFLRILPQTNQVSFMVSHNFGLVSLEEGYVSANNTLRLKTNQIDRMSFSKDPKVMAFERTYKLLQPKNQLEYTLTMETSNTPMTDHLKVVYEKS